MANGYVKIHRKMLENPVVNKDCEHLAVWMYLLLNATHKSIDMMFCGKKVTLRAGQLITGRKKISAEMGISESKVYRILKLFKSEQQIEQQTCPQNSLITIVNWGSYQNYEQQNEQQVNNDRTTSEQQVNTNKNDKNVKNDKNDKKREVLTHFITPSLDEVKAYCQERNNNINADHFINFYSAKGWMVGKNKMKDWKAAIRTWESRDKQDTPQMPDYTGGENFLDMLEVKE